ncbi:serine hydrolase domain-containing protein [Promicromonospora sp. NPDC019610]|uniref:serine hydrolase domain-containing protein n=1 Tax=Promicromonospora sp. NPDC019610 TaxID=3364405 RepID=UPI003797FB7D
MTDRIEELLDEGVRNRVFPGAVWAVGGAAGYDSHGVVGVLDPDYPQVPMASDTIFDVASLTKLIAVWSSVGTLWEEGKLDLGSPLGAFWPEVRGRPLGSVTAHQILTHTAGLPLRAQLKNLYGTDRAEIRAGVLREALNRPPGQAVDYTDRAAIILGYLVEHLSGQSLDQFAGDRVWEPLGMDATRFGPLSADVARRSAPTELDEDLGAHLKGVAHDFSARLLGGVCGSAGAFTTLDDLSAFLCYLLDATTAARPVGFGASWTQESLRVRTGALEPMRGLFWHPAPDTDLAADVWVHYGFTGCGMWVSLRQERWALLLTNKLYYNRDRSPLTAVRDAFRALVFD